MTACHLFDSNSYTHESNNHNNSPWTVQNRDRTFVRAGSAICSHSNRYILLAGGRHHSRSVVELDLKTGVGTELLSLPQSYHKCSIAVLYNSMYLIASHEDRPIYRKSLPQIMMKENNWSEINGKGSLPQYRTLVSNENRLFSFGYRGNAVYNPCKNNWTKVPSMKSIIYVYATLVLDQQILVIGSKTNDYHFDRNKLMGEIWDISSSTWRVLPGFTKDLWNVNAAIFWNRWIILIGKENKESFFSFFIHDIKTGEMIRSPVTRRFVGNDVQITIVGESLVIVGDLDPVKESTVESIPVSYLLPNWFMVMHLILLRRLCEQGRASPNKDKEEKWNECEKANETLQKLILNMNEDMFRNVLCFLIPTNF